MARLLSGFMRSGTLFAALVLGLSGCLSNLSSSEHGRASVFAEARDRVIYTREVAYCSTGRAVNVDRFDIRFYPTNNSIGFDISARSVAANLNADLNIELIAYGKSYINLTANLCDILGGALCPLPQYQFDGSFAYVLPDSVNIDLPGIAFTVADLDAYAQIKLINQQTGAESLCLGATLSNGHTVRLTAVAWGLGAIAILAFVCTLIHSFFPLAPYKSGPEWRFATILSYFQHVAMCGFLSLDYPLVYKNFTLNYTWSQGLIYARPINDAIDRMRHMTGGLNVEGRTFTVISEEGSALNQSSSGFASYAAASSAAAAQHTIPEVQAAPSYSLISGIETSTSLLGITYANAFMTVFIFFLLFCCIMIALSLIATGAVVLYSAIKHRRVGYANLQYFNWTNWLRIFLSAYTPLILFMFWQFRHLRDSGWLAVFLAALTFVWLHLAIFGIYWHVSKVAHRAVNHPDERVSLRWSTVSKQFKKAGQAYLILLSVAAFASAAFVAFAQGHALVQVIALIVIELIVFVCFCVWRPFANRGSNVLMIFISIFKIVSYGLLIAFYYKLEYNGIIKAVLGYVVLAIQAIMSLILFFVTLYNLGTGILWSRQARRNAIAEHRQAMSEKGGEKQHVRPFLHPRTTGLEDGDGNYRYDTPVERSGATTDYNTAFPNSTYAPANGQYNEPPPVSNLYLPTPDSPSQEGRALSAPSATHDSSSLSDRTVVAPEGENHNNASSSSLGGFKSRAKNVFGFRNSKS